MLTKFNKHIKENLPFICDCHLLVAVSGGLDSVVLTHLLKQLKLKFSIAHCNFKLRGKESDEDEKFVKSLALKIGVKFYSKSFETSLKKHSIQMAARELRYKWFNELLLKNKMKYVLTAHHLDDSIETFFINLTRSTGIQGLLGLKNIKSSGVYPVPMISHSTDFPFSLMPNKSEKVLVKYCNEILKKNAQKTKKNDPESPIAATKIPRPLQDGLSQEKESQNPPSP